MRPTPEQVRAYVDADGGRCLFCGSAEIEAGPVEADADSAHGLVSCETCGGQWRDVFVLAAVDQVDDGGRYVDTVEPAPREDA
jgi:transcription elongation factor Elf1